MKLIIAFFFIFFCFVTSATASNIKIDPIRLQMNCDEKITLLNITNQGSKQVSIQLTAYEWAQNNGQDILSDTSDLILIPPLLSIKPGEKSSIRVARRNINEINIEQNYRILIKEFALPSKEASATLKLMLNISLPLFIVPKTIVTNFSWKIDTLSPKKKRVILTNNSNIHTKITDIKLVNHEDKVVSVPLNTFSYVLPYQSKEWEVYTYDNLVNDQLKVISNLDLKHNIS